MKTYQCHKQVQAAKIAAVQITGPSTAMIEFESGGCHSVDRAFLTKHDPQPGGYLVRYEDGYLSYSPAKAFDEGYTAIAMITMEEMRALLDDAAKNASFQYDEVDIKEGDSNDGAVEIQFGKAINGLYVQSGVGTGGYVKDRAHAESLAKVAVARAAKWFAQLEGVEQEIQSKGLTAPRVTPADIEANIASEHYFTAADGAIGSKWNAVPRKTIIDTSPASLHMLTFCVLVLKCGYPVTGESVFASARTFNAQIGRMFARQDAIQKVRSLMDYEIHSKLAATRFE